MDLASILAGVHTEAEILIDLDLPLLHDSVLLTDLSAHIYKRSLQRVSVDSLPSWPSRRRRERPLDKGDLFKATVHNNSPMD